MNHFSVKVELCLTELLRRSYQEIENLRKELDAFKHPQPKQHIRKRKTFIFNKQELDDDEIVYLVDNDYISIRELEKDVGANKNQLRNRYLRAKALQK